MASWKPHGLILEAAYEPPYLEASTAVDLTSNLATPKKNRVIFFFENLFRGILFPESRFTINSGLQPHDARSGKPCDIFISAVNAEWQPETFCFCFATARGEGADWESELGGLERTVEGYCREHCSGGDVKSMYVCVLAGSGIRCWRYGAGEGMVPLWDGGAYKDVGRDEDKDDILGAVSEMKSGAPEGPDIG